MPYNLKEVMSKKERLKGGHRLCAGCGASIVVRSILRALNENDPAVICAATGCLEVSTCIYPYTSWEDSFIHTAFENASATMSGIIGAYKNLKIKGKLNENYKFIVFAGDGGTYDIGFQSLSGASERNENMLYVCYNNGAYMNTGIQRSSATPIYADTTTSPCGKKVKGKMEPIKDMTEIMAAHKIPYVAQTAPIGNFKDIGEKAEKALYTEGFCFINALAPCPRGWRYDTPQLMEIVKFSVDSLIWPIYEVEYGKYKINYRPSIKIPVEEYLNKQGRFKHLFKVENKWMIEKYQKHVDKKWEELQKLEEMTNKQ